MSYRPIWDSINTNKKTRRDYSTLFVDTFSSIHSSKSDFRYRMTLPSLTNGKRVDFYADINGGVPRSHQSRWRNIAYFFDRSCFLHIFFLPNRKEKSGKKTHFLLLFNSKGLKMRSENSVVAQKRIY